MQTTEILLFSGRSLISRLIQWQTRSPWSHVALVRGDLVIEAREFRGVVCRSIEDVVSEARRRGDRLQRFQVRRCDGLVARGDEAWAFASRQLGKRYDYGSVLRFISRRQARRRSAGIWFCSELAFAAWRHAGIDLLVRIEPWAVSPGLLAISPMVHPSPAVDGRRRVWPSK